MDDRQRIAIVETKTGEQSLTRYQLDNHLGSSSIELDENANLISYEEYHPFGTTSYRAGRNVAEVSLKRYRYTGKEKDEETGLHYHGARYYAPWIGRWVSVDPHAENYLAYSPYHYAADNPILVSDPNGMDWYIDSNGGLIHVPDHTGAMESSIGLTHYAYEAEQILETLNVSGDNSSNFSANDNKMSMYQVLNSNYNNFNGNVRRYINKYGTMTAGLTIGCPFAIIGGVNLGVASAPYVGQALNWLYEAGALTNFGLDFGVQMAATEGDIANWNITQSLAATVSSGSSLKSLFYTSATQATVSSGLQITPQNIKNQRYFGSTIFGGKSIAKFGVESTIGTFFNFLGGAASTSSTKGIINKHGGIWGGSISGNAVNIIGNGVSNKIKK